jgi:hypothetical protein
MGRKKEMYNILDERHRKYVILETCSSLEDYLSILTDIFAQNQKLEPEETTVASKRFCYTSFHVKCTKTIIMKLLEAVFFMSFVPR